jgi:hypothetical protein
MLKQCVGLQPGARALAISEELTAPVFLRGKAAQCVISTMIEEAFEEEVVFECLGIFGHVACRSVDIGQSFADVLACSDAICIRTKGLGQALLDLLNARISPSGSGMNLRHRVPEPTTCKQQPRPTAQFRRRRLLPVRPVAPNITRVLLV